MYILEVCVCVYFRACMYTFEEYACVYILEVRMHVHMCVHFRGVCVHVCMHVYLGDLCAHVCTSEVCVCMHVRFVVSVCMCVGLFVCAWLSVYLVCTYVSVPLCIFVYSVSMHAHLACVST